MGILRTMGILGRGESKIPAPRPRGKIPTLPERNGNLGYLNARKDLQSKIPKIPKIPMGVGMSS